MSDKPNILLIMCDQLRADALGCYGNKFVQTPNMDRLARRGVTFINAYSQTPVCIPARYGLISGLNPFELGLIDNGTRTKEVQYPLPELIRSSGYYTCAIGKMHFKPIRKHYGFDRMYLSEEIVGHIENDDYLQFLRDNGYGHVIEPHGRRSENYYVPQTSELPEEMHSSAWVADVTSRLIRNNRNRPFFMFASFIKPHPPFDPCVPYDTMYDPEQIPLPVRAEHERDSVDFLIHVQNDYKVNGIENASDENIRKIRAAYYGSITQLDKQIGKILDTLDQYELSKNTLVILTADHGEMLGDHYSFGKRNFYEASTRIPLIASWPSQLPQGETREQLAMLQDIYATAIHASGGEVPEQSSGLDLVQAAKDAESPLHDKIFAEIGRKNALKMMVRWDRYKYVYHVNGGEEQLFDLSSDPNELQNIAKEYPALCSDCREQMVRHYRKYGYEEALDGDQLVRYEKADPPRKGFLNQYPKWPKSVLPEGITQMLLVLILLIGLIGCSSQPEAPSGTAAPAASVKEQSASIDTTPVEVQIFSKFAETALDFDEVFVKPVQAKYPFITPKLTVEEKGVSLETLITAGKAPDMVITTVLNAFPITDAGLTSDLNPLIKKHSFDVNRIEPAYMNMVKEYSSKGELIALPYTANFNALFYNKDIFDKFGVAYPKDNMTWAETIELGKRVSRVADGIQYRGIDPENLERLASNWGYAYSDPKTDKPVFDKWKPAFELFKEIISIPNNSPDKVVKNDRKAFIEDKVVAMRASSNIVPNLQEAEDKGTGFNWDLVTYPKVDAKQNHFGVAGARIIMISPESKVKDQAFKIIETLPTDQSQINQSKRGVMSPLVSLDVQKTLGASMSVLKGKNIQAAYKLKPGFRSITRYDDQGISTLFNKSLELYKGVDVNTVIREANEDLEKKIQTVKVK